MKQKRRQASRLTAIASFMKISLSQNQSSLEDQQQVLRSFMKIKPTLANLEGLRCSRDFRKWWQEIFFVRGDTLLSHHELEFKYSPLSSLLQESDSTLACSVRSVYKTWLFGKHFMMIPITITSNIQKKIHIPSMFVGFVRAASHQPEITQSICWQRYSPA